MAGFSHAQPIHRTVARGWVHRRSAVRKEEGRGRDRPRSAEIAVEVEKQWIEMAVVPYHSAIRKEP